MRGLYLFIIGYNAKKYEDAIICDIKSHFEIFRVYEVNWSEKFFAYNLARFYGKKLPKGAKKEKEVGLGTFKVVLVYDNKQHMVKGKNTRILCAKRRYRKMCGANMIHASDNVAETNENLLFLFGKTANEIVAEQNEKSIVSYNQDVKGCFGWNSWQEALNIVNKLPMIQIKERKHKVCIYGPQPSLIRRVLNARKGLWPFGHKYFIRVHGKKCPLYID